MARVMERERERGRGQTAKGKKKKPAHVNTEIPAQGNNLTKHIKWQWKWISVDTQTAKEITT